MLVLYWYCLMKAVIKSFHERIWEASKLVYQMTVALAKLSWKKCISSFSSLEYAPIFQQYIFRWFLGQVVPLYLTKSGTLNFGGMTTSSTKHNYVMLAKGYSPNPSIALNLSSMRSSFTLPSTAGGGPPTEKCSGCRGRVEEWCNPTPEGHWIEDSK